MKILEISHLYPVYYDLFNGIAIHKQIKILKNKGCEVLVISPIPWTPFPIKYMSNKWKKYSKIPCYDIIEDIKVFHPRYLSFPKAYFFASSGIYMYHGIKKLVKKLWHVFPFDLIHTHMGLPDGYAGMLLSMDYNKPLIVTIRGTDLDSAANRNIQCIESLQKVFNKANKVVSPSPQLSYKFYRHFKINPVTICNGIDLEEIYSGKSNLYFKYKNRYILLSASRLIKTKGIDLNLYALKRLISKFNNLFYLIIGDGPVRENLEQLTNDLGLKKYVEFLGQQTHCRVMEYMSICNIFSMPSWQETFGLVYTEAIAHGKPIIGCQGQGVDGIVEHGKTGMLVKPKDVDSLVKAMDYLLSNPNEARAIGKRAHELVLENYTWDKNAEKTMEAYNQVLNDVH